MSTSVSRRIGVSILALGLALTPVSASTAATARPGETHVVSVNAEGEHANAASFEPVISPNGRYVAFQSLATNLVEDYGKPASLRDGFVHDRETGEVRRVAVPEDGDPPDAWVWVRQFSPDSRYLLFETAATGLVPGVDNSALDVYLLSLETWELEHISVGTEGEVGNDSSFGGKITADNRYVVFTSYASNWFDEVPDGDVSQIYLRDRELGTTELISRNADGEVADSWGAAHAGISADGRFVVFGSIADNLDDVDIREDDLNHIFLLDRDTGEVRLVDRGRKDPIVANHSFDPRISADGSLITFTTGAPMAAGDTNFQWDVYGYDRLADRMERISIGSAGQEVSRNSSRGRPSERYVVFDGGRGLQDGSDTSGIMAYLHDRVTGLTEPLAVAADGTLGDSNATDPWATPDGRLVVFRTQSRLVPEVTGGGAQIYLRDRGPELGIGSLSAATDDVELHASGWSTFTGGILGEATSDLVATGRSEAGMDLEYARVVHRADQEELFVRFDLAGLVPSANTWGAGFVPANRTGAGLPATVYGLSFEVDGVRHEARVARSVEEALGASARLYRCDPMCQEVAGLDGSIGSAGNEARLVVPLAALDADEGAELTAVRAFAGPGDLRVGAVPADTLDLPDAVIPARAVQLGLAPQGTLLDAVDFSFAAALTDGRFSGDIDVASLPAGHYDLWARACLGEVCDGAMSAPVTLGDSIDEIKDTILELAVEGQGQNMILKARLTEFDGPQNPIAERTIYFYADTELIGSGSTDSNGVAEVPVPPGHRGANRTYEAVFEGDDLYRGSSDSRPGRGGQAEANGSTDQRAHPYRGAVVPL